METMNRKESKKGMVVTVGCNTLGDDWGSCCFITLLIPISAVLYLVESEFRFFRGCVICTEEANEQKMWRKEEKVSYLFRIQAGMAGIGL